MLITFTVNDQKITHDLKQSLVAGSSGIVKAAFEFDSSWDELAKVIVFTNSSCSKPYPIKWADEQIDIPACVLQAGKLYVSCVGFGDSSTRKTTQAWDIQQAITVQKCGDMGSCELLRNLAQTTSSGVDEDSVATDAEVAEMLAGVFGTSADTGSTDDSGTSGGSSTVADEEVASDAEVAAMLASVFNS